MTFEEFISSKGLVDKFPKGITAAVGAIQKDVLEADIKGRRDLRGMKIVTIDGDDAKDLDDAVSLETLPNGNFYLGVHIADVAHYVAEGSEIDKEAFNRATSVYLINRVLPMLPKELSNGICSLNPKVNRLTLSCFMEINKGGAVVNYDICESVIKTAERMTYKNVQAILDGDPAVHKQYSHLADLFFDMEKCAKILEHKRIKRGSIMFEFPEAYIVLDDDDKPLAVEKYEIKQSNKIIEEFMLIANETIARHINHLNLPLVYRIHEEPDTEKIAKFKEMLGTQGFKLRASDEGKVRPKDMQEILNQIAGKESEQAISTIMLRSLMKAKYSPNCVGHFGLAAKYYCHFTSPIRRYPDLVVHRIVKDWLHKRLGDKRKGWLERFCENAAVQSSEREILAMQAERDWDDYKMAEFMEQFVGDDFDCFIASVTSFGLFVQLDNLVEGLVHIRELEGDYYIFDEVNYILRGKHTGTEYKIGDKMRVKLVRVNTELSQIDFVPVGATPHLEASSATRKKQVPLSVGRPSAKTQKAKPTVEARKVPFSKGTPQNASEARLCGEEEKSRSVATLISPPGEIVAAKQVSTSDRVKRKGRHRKNKRK
ncbi:MAG: ribonuclease R [Oscillospiraceae bacterium]|nr:ribonuclease R [Oscillospiraceae bacterium]